MGLGQWLYEITPMDARAAAEAAGLADCDAEDAEQQGRWLLLNLCGCLPEQVDDVADLGVRVRLLDDGREGDWLALDARELGEWRGDLEMQDVVYSRCENAGDLSFCAVPDDVVDWLAAARGVARPAAGNVMAYFEWC